MLQEPAARSEQVALNRILELAFEEMHYGLMGANARIIVLRSFTTPEELEGNYLRAIGRTKLADRRRSQSTMESSDKRLLQSVQDAAFHAFEYAQWSIRAEDRQPVYRDVLASYCTSFESFWKNVAVVFKLAQLKKQGLEDQVFVPSDQFSRALAEVRSAWDSAPSYRVLSFVQSEVVARNPAPSRFKLEELADKSMQVHWVDCSSATILRNAVVHQLGRLSEQVSIGQTVHRAGWQVQLTLEDLEIIASSMRKLGGYLDPCPL